MNPSKKASKQTNKHPSTCRLIIVSSLLSHLCLILSDKYLSLLDFQSLPCCRGIRSIPLTLCIFNKGAISFEPQKSLLLVMIYATKRTQSDFFFRPRYMKLSIQCCKLGGSCFQGCKLHITL